MTEQQQALTLAEVDHKSRLFFGNDKYSDFQKNLTELDASAAEIIMVAIRRVNLGQNSDEPKHLALISPKQYTILPNTAGCYTSTLSWYLR